jgi:hypothetical protein
MRGRNELWRDEFTFVSPKDPGKWGDLMTRLVKERVLGVEVAKEAFQEGIGEYRAILAESMGDRKSMHSERDALKIVADNLFEGALTSNEKLPYPSEFKRLEPLLGLS